MKTASENPGHNEQPHDSEEWRRAQVEKRDNSTNDTIGKVQALIEQYGLELPEPLIAEAKKLALPYTVYLPGQHINEHTVAQEPYETLIVPCRITTNDNQTLDPCLLLFSSSKDLWPSFNGHVLVGGQVANIEPSSYAMPKEIIDRLHKRPEISMGTELPLAVKFPAQEYLIPANSYFFATAAHTAADLTSAHIEEPDETTQKKGLYEWADNLQSNITYVLCSDGDESKHV